MASRRKPLPWPGKRAQQQAVQASTNRQQILAEIALYPDRLSELKSAHEVAILALKQAQEAYIIFHKFLKYFGYTMLFLIFLLYLNDFFNDPTASRHLPEEIADQYDPKGLNIKKGI